MKTIRSTGPQLIAVHTDASKSRKVPNGKVHVLCVRYETYEMDLKVFDKTTFNIHDANQEEAKIIAEAVKL